MLSAFLGSVNRHFGDRVTAMTIRYSWRAAAISLARLRPTMTGRPRRCFAQPSSAKVASRPV
jgi:hypothetical protein